MRIYVIDTARVAFWHQLNLDNLFFVCDAANEHQYSFDCDDLVFAHSHPNYVTENPDLVLDSMNNNWLKVQKFCRALVACPDDARPLAVVLYSGGDCRDEWKTLATANDATLNGFSQEHIHCYPPTIPRQQSAEALRNMIDAVRAQLQTARQGEPVSLDTSSLEEAKLAVRLLVEASELPTGESNGIKVVKPATDLVELAKQVIDRTSTEQNLAAAAKDLCEKLASLK